MELIHSLIKKIIMRTCAIPKEKIESPYTGQDSKFTRSNSPYAKDGGKFSSKENPYDTILCIDETSYIFQDDSRFILQDNNELIFNL